MLLHTTMSVYSWLILILLLDKTRTLSVSNKCNNILSHFSKNKYLYFLWNPPNYFRKNFLSSYEETYMGDNEEESDNIALAEDMERGIEYYIEHEDMETDELAQEEDLSHLHKFNKEDYMKAIECWKQYINFFPEDITEDEFYKKIEEYPLRPLKFGKKTIKVYELGYGYPWYLPNTEYVKLQEIIGKNQADYVTVERFDEYKTKCHNLGGFLHRGGFIELSTERSALLPYVKIVSIKRNLPDLDYEIILKDTKRNVTFSYIQSKFKIKQRKYKPYYPKPLWHPIKYDFYQRKTLDDDIFRQPRLEDLRMKKFDTVNFMKFDPEKGAPYGFYREFQNFWPVTKTVDNGEFPSMRFFRLGNSDLEVSQVGLGTMTFENESATTLLDYGFDKFHINFFDTSELYPFPVTKETYGHAEKILGSWIKRRGAEDRKKMVIATKVAGPSKSLGWIRSSNPPSTKLNREQIIESVDNSLDLLQFHWPDRYYPSQSNPDYENMAYDTRMWSGDDSEYYESVLKTVDELLRAGKIRAWGLSNETPTGLLKFYSMSKELNVQQPASIQLEYNLLARNDLEKGFVELSRPQNTGIGLIAYSPLAGGLLTGKYLEYLDGTTNARLIKFPSYMARLRGSLASRAVKEYYDMALEYHLPNLTVMALKWVYSRPFINTTLIGANDLYQLRESLYCVDDEIPMTDMMERHINQVHWKWRDPIRIIQ